MTNSNKFYITTSLPYTNAPPHLGFALELVQADVLARYHRLLGEEVFFLTGTDEHGAKNAKAAQKQGKTPERFTEEISYKFRNLLGALNISTNDFIRTTDQKRHWPAAQKVWLMLKKNGDIYKKKYSGVYCVGHEAFITSKDLKNGKCILHLSEPEKIDEENYFFRLTRYSKKIKDAIEKNKIKIIPEGRRREMLSFVAAGLENISFSRPAADLKWGIPVPDDTTQTMYVWCDALTNYISALGFAENRDKFKKFWPADIHCLGKDILRFHAIIWPAMLFSLGLELPKSLMVHGLITVGGQKMSKTIGNVIDPFELIKKYGADPVRYYLLREIPPTGDGDYTEKKFIKRYNSDLASGLGNLVARVTAMAEKIGLKNSEIKPTAQTLRSVERVWKEYKKELDEFKFNKALEAIWDLISRCDKQIDEKKPWEKGNDETIKELLFLLAHIASMLGPFMPQTSEKIFWHLGIESSSATAWHFKAQRGDPFFPRI